MRRFEKLIDGKKVAAASGKWMASLDPYRNENWCKIPDSGPQDVDAAVSAAKSAFRSPGWAGLSATARGALLRKVGDLIAANAKRLAELEVRDNGKLINEMSRSRERSGDDQGLHAGEDRLAQQLCRTSAEPIHHAVDPRSRSYAQHSWSECAKKNNPFQK